MREITVITPQGIGDIWWVYQKLYPYYDEINIRVMTLDTTKHQTRAFPWVAQWPKVKSVEMHLSTHEQYMALAQSKPHLTGTEEGTISYAANKLLEEGTRIEDIDPSVPVAWDIPLQTNDSLQTPEKYISVFISGNYPPYVWSTAQWAEFIDKFYSYGGYDKSYSICLLGAFYDKDILTQLKNLLASKNYDTHIYIDCDPAAVLGLLKKSEWYLGYQSGLNVLADNLGVKQVMVYFPEIRPMLYSWCKKEHIKTKFFASTFDRSPEEVMLEIWCP